ncbi:adenine DNA glycosylase [Brachionichthys hirsutus]|uniref:adenine DNA glycosylase n=1 Tax=Brachionichthys hirsutus TaxID=412623 RepID=UPI003604C2FE
MEVQANIGKVLNFLGQWDRGDRTVRSRMLKTFLAQNAGKTFYELEVEFAQVASLFLARLTTWTRLTYTSGTFLVLQLKSIGIFLSAACHDQYLAEFVQDGGVFILLEISSLSRSREEELKEALRLLLAVSNAGRKYKEMICDSRGVKTLTVSLAESNTDESQDAAWAVLESLSYGNPKYQSQVYKGLIPLMTCSSPRAQQLVLHTLHTMQAKMKTAPHSIVEPLLDLLRSLHLEVQAGAINLILDLKDYDVRPVLLSGLVALLRPTKEMQQQQNMEESAIIKITGSLPVFVQQAAAAKTIRFLAEGSKEISRELLSLGVIRHLLYAMGNREHTDAQVQAGLALEHFVRSYPVLEDQVQRVAGIELFTALMHKSDSLYMDMDEAQAEMLLTNTVHITEGIDSFIVRLVKRIFRSMMPRRKRTGLEMAEKAKPTRKRSKTALKEEETTDASPLSTFHFFHDAADVELLRSRLLRWYDEEKRELPWRTLAATEPDLNIRTYAVWVSEIMLQQTQVATVIDYYNKWMRRWPTAEDLAAATLEEVNQMWAGLGYYSRGKRLHAGAQKVVTELQGQMPRTADSLLKQLPGVGRYTAAAIGSIALGQVTGAVDGNVIRVLCRIRAVGADSTSPAVTDTLWRLVNMLVDPERPGDFNQAMMELGARVCTPKGPLCSRCPVQSHCHSYRKVKKKHVKQGENSRRLFGKLDEKPSPPPDIEDCRNGGTCPLCPSEPWDDEMGVQNFPRKPAKKPPRVERTLTCVVIRAGEEDEYLLSQRPDNGLLAGLWDFPSLLQEEKSSEVEQKKALCAEISRISGMHLTADLQRVGEVVHIFSHIRQTYVVHSVRLKDSDTQTQSGNTRWLTRSALEGAAVSTGVKKILKRCDPQKEQTSKDGKTQKHGCTKNRKNLQTSKRPRLDAADGSRRRSLSSFFKTVKQEC